MIAKRVTREKGSRFALLARYILDAKNDGAKVELARATNIDSGPEDGFELAIAVITATQAKNSRARADRTYHLVVSFPPGERPSPEQLRDIEHSLVDAIGLGDHQRISAVHVDTSHLHLHVAINKIQPVTFRLIEPYYDKLALQKVCRELEVRHGLQRLPPRTRRVDGGRSSGTGVDADAGVESFLRWARTNVVPPLRDVLATSCASWENVHGVLARFDVELRLRGAGFVLKARSGRSTAQPSELGRDLSFRALQNRLGAFVPAGPSVAEIVPVMSYRPPPVYRSPESARLFVEYQQVRSELHARREVAREAARLEERLLNHQLRAWYAERRALIRQATTLSRVEKRIAYMELARERQGDLMAARARRRNTRNAFIEKHPLPTWSAFLLARARGGDLGAIETLRSNANRRRTSSTSAVPPDNGVLLTVPAAAARLAPPLLGIANEVRPDGSIGYDLPDGGQVVDSAASIAVAPRSPEAIRTALAIAAARFGDAPVDVRGGPEACRELRDVARELQPRMIFTVTSDEHVAALDFRSTVRARQAGEEHRGPTPAQDGRAAPRAQRGPS